ncbi:hypothetical protein MARA_36750 [Mycolicibacterium arabiense]|uniref:ATPase AAA n=1 Tax=Mycolicibacterium arabiense TaxID=1286181 RepID=A0A7I7S055_9MYCO|nr:hypothetical protein [Mycolicibacterium arabiense]MCV7371503.1 hypothetical protein [Mycolicibacterium arabiense]BBY50207.1 hypothetical protein MARA_36750 [Mycolicibacterium arabiense]
MAARHRKARQRARNVAVVATATATVSALTMGAAPAPQPTKAVSEEAVDLAAAIRLLPNSSQVPDITGGLGTVVYNGGQAIGDQLVRAVVNGINLAALAQAAGVDPRSLVNSLLAELPANLLPGILSALALDLPVLDTVLDQVPGIGQLLADVLDALGLDEAVDGSLTGLLALIGLDLSNPLNLSNLLDLAGVNIVTAGPTFSVLKMLGLDLGWTPSFPNSVANEINGSPYLEIGANGILTNLLDRLNDNPLIDVIDPLGLLRNGLSNAIEGLTGNIPDVLDLRVVPTIGIGLGAFAAAMAYEQVLADLDFQPGGALHEFGGNPLLGSLTLLPMVLINNPARPDGGMFARFGPLAALFGINTVNPTTQVSSSGGLGGPLGTSVGGANLVPILIDATYEYQPLSDFASWPNPFTLGNNAAAALLPTYMLRGLTLEGLDEQVIDLINEAVGEATELNNPLALNLYLTLQSKTLPMLEPLYLASDFLNIVGLSPLAQIPMRLANALAPALSILTNIGYSNVVRNADGTYTRDFTDAGVETPFLSFANIDYGRALSDSFNALLGGFQKEFFSGNPTQGTPNVLKNLLDALLKGNLLGGTGAVPSGQTPGTVTNPLAGLLGGLTGVINNLLGGLLGGGIGAAATPLAASTLNANLDVADIPATDARFSKLSISGGAGDETISEATESSEEGTEGEAEEGQTEEGQAAEGDGTGVTPEAPADEETTDEEAAEDEVIAETPSADETESAAEEPAAEEESAGPKHAKPEGEDEPEESSVDEPTTPKHAKPDTDTSTGAAAEGSTKKPSLNVVRDTANASSPADKPGPTSSTTAGGGDEKAAATDADAGSDDSASGGSESDAA